MRANLIFTAHFRDDQSEVTKEFGDVYYTSLESLKAEAEEFCSLIEGAGVECVASYEIILEADNA